MFAGHYLFWNTKRKGEGEMNDYIAWIKYEGEIGQGHSIARGTLKGVEQKAMEAVNGKDWKFWSDGRKSNILITRGAKQLFVKSILV
jgi:hypothetical protein